MQKVIGYIYRNGHVYKVFASALNNLLASGATVHTMYKSKCGALRGNYYFALMRAAYIAGNIEARKFLWSSYTRWSKGEVSAHHIIVHDCDLERA